MIASAIVLVLRERLKSRFNRTLGGLGYEC